MASLTRKIAANTGIQIIGKAVTTVISLVTVAMMTRYLGVDGYGRYLTIFAFLEFFGIIADLGLLNIAVRDMATSPAKASSIFGNILTLRIILALILFIAPLVALFIPPYDMAMRVGILIGSLSLFFVTTAQLFVGVFQLNLRMDRLVISEGITGLVLLALTGFGIRQSFGIDYFITATIIANIVKCIVSYIFARRFFYFRLEFDTTYWKKVIHDAVPIGLNMMLVLIYFKLDAILLSILKDTTAVGYYSAPYKILAVLISIPSMYMGVVNPLIARYLTNKDERLVSSFHKSFDFISILALPMLVGVFVLAQPIIVLILGPEFIASEIVLRYLVFGAFTIYFSTIFGNYIVVANLQRKMTLFYAVSVVFNVVGNIILIPYISYIGSSIMTVATELLVLFAAGFLVYSKLNLFPRFVIFAKAFVAAGVMGIFYYLAGETLPLIIVFPLGGLIYLFVLYVIGGIDKKTIASIIGKVA